MKGIQKLVKPDFFRLSFRNCISCVNNCEDRLYIYLKYKARVIWKTTTSMCKEKDIGSRLKADWQRFLNLPVGIQLTVV